MMPGKRSAEQSEKGFTLLEMMVAVTLVALMAVGIWSIFRTTVRAWSRGTEYIDANQRRRNILDMVRKQIASAYPLAAPPDPAMPVSVNPIFHGTESSLHFISLNSLHFQDSPGLTLVNYEVTQDPLGGAYLLGESEERYLWQSAGSESETDPPATTLLFGNLAECYFEYSSDDPEEPWVREWDAQERGQLPEAIAMTMTATDMDGVTRNHRVIVPIHATLGTLQMNILNRGGIRQSILGGRMPGRGTGRPLDLNLESRPEGGPGRGTGRGFGRGTGRGPGRGPGIELDERFQDLLRRRLEREQPR